MVMNYHFVPLQTPPTLLTRFITGVIAAFPCAAVAWMPGGDPVSSASATTGLSVATNNRNDVVAFWHAVYQASEGYHERVGWTGNYSGKNGKLSKEFEKDVERRVNYFRAMCGVPAAVNINANSTVFIESTDSHKPPASTLKSDAAQASAMMLIRNYDPSTGKDPAITHDPAKSLTGWSTQAWNGNAHGNLAFGIFGPGAITEYMVEEISNGSTTSFWNALVGHRRWILFPEATNFATGDQPGDSVSRPPTNVLYISQKPDELIPDPTPGFVAFPSPGYFPAPVNSRYWSVSRSGADFSAATVKMTDSGGNPVTVSGIKRNANYGDPAIIWEVGGATSSKSVFSDATYNVKITGIGGTGIPSSYSYSVTLINPDRLTSNQTISGSSGPIANQTTNYTFTPPPGAEALGITAYMKRTATWVEGAEKKQQTRVIDRTAANYPLYAKTSSFAGFGNIAGPRAFHLTFPVAYDLMARGTPEQSFELDRLILPGANGQLRFLFRRGFMTKTSTLVVEVSRNGGLTWSQAGKAIKGASNTATDVKISTAVVKLPQSVEPVRVRFRYFTKPGTPIYTHEAAPTSPTGIFIDNITTKNCTWLEPRKTTYLPTNATTYQFNATTAGGALSKGSRWGLAMRTKLGGKWFPAGPVKSLVVAAP